ncbi:MAG: ankyrin repeat domain-containing protein [Steroidobacteraceae bacterium]
MSAVIQSYKVTQPGRLLAILVWLVSAHAHGAAPGALADAAMRGDIPAMKALLKDGAEPNVRGKFGTPALHWLVDADNSAAVQILLKAGADVNALTERDVSPLSLAIANANVGLVDLLLKAGANPNQPEPTGETLLMMAAQIGTLPVVNMLLQRGVEVDARERSFGQTALMFAARAGHPEVVAALLAKGAQPNVATTVGSAPQFVKPNSQAGFGFGIGILRGGVPADRGRREPAPGGLTPLHYAARHNHVEVAKLLLQAGAKVNAREANDITPLLMAVGSANVATALFLLEHGGDVNAVDWYGRTPLWEAVNVRNLYVHNSNLRNGIDRASMLPLINALLKAGANVNARTKETPPVRQYLLPTTGTLEWVDFTGQTPFLAAALAGDLTVMKLLLESGADPRIDTFRGTSALMAAAGVNWVFAQTYTEGPEQLLEAVKLCHSLGMDVNQANSMGVTALHGAANRGSEDIIRFLVEKGANLEAQDNEHRSAVDWAKGVFLATHPPEPKPGSIALLTTLLKAQGKEIR